MQPFYESEPRAINYKGIRVPIKASYDRVLKCCAILKEDLFDDIQKIDMCLYLIAKNSYKWLRRPPEIRVTLFTTIWKILMPPARGDSQKSAPILDFDLDSAYIFASFWQAYRIDLARARNRLSWFKFIALFGGLPDNTKIKEVMEIRARKIPAPTKYNQEEIQQLLKLKSYYALPGRGGDNYQEGLEKLFGVLKEQAVKK